METGVTFYELFHTFVTGKTQIMAVLRYLLVISLMVIAITGLAQDKPERKIVQLSGIVIGEDSTATLPGVHIYVPTAGRGTTTNAYGYFSLPVLTGDSLIISAVGFHKQNFIVPFNQGDDITELFQLEVDTIFLENVDILPYPTEEALKQAWLALRLPDETKQLRESLNGEYLAYMIKNTPLDGSLSASYYLDQQLYYQINRYGGISNPFLNPFNWVRFIQDLKSGKYKKKDKN